MNELFLLSTNQLMLWIEPIFNHWKRWRTADHFPLVLPLFWDVIDYYSGGNAQMPH